MSNAPSSGINSEVEPMEVQPTADPETKSEVTLSPSARLPVSIEQKVFGGRIQTSYECCRCHTISIHNETFNDLLLPFPDTKETSTASVTQSPESTDAPESADAPESTDASESTTSLSNEVKLSESKTPTKRTKSVLTMQVTVEAVFFHFTVFQAKEKVMQYFVKMIKMIKHSAEARCKVQCLYYLDQFVLAHDDDHHLLGALNNLWSLCRIDICAQKVDLANIFVNQIKTALFKRI